MSDVEELASFYRKYGGAINDIRDLRERALLAEVKLKASEDRCTLLLEAKNLWMDRALAAEKQGTVISQAEEQDNA